VLLALKAHLDQQAHPVLEAHQELMGQQVLLALLVRLV
jgi:hypothetical protein